MIKTAMGDLNGFVFVRLYSLSCKRMIPILIQIADFFLLSYDTTVVFVRWWWMRILYNSAIQRLHWFYLEWQNADWFTGLRSH